MASTGSADGGHTDVNSLNVHMCFCMCLELKKDKLSIKLVLFVLFN